MGDLTARADKPVPRIFHYPGEPPAGEVALRHARRMLASQTDARRELDRPRSGNLAGKT